MNEILRAIEAEQMRNDLPNFRIGDTVKLHVKIKEGNRERIQMFEGTVIKRQNGGLRETFTVRRLAYGVGVERTFPVNSPIIEKMEITRRGKVRRACGISEGRGNNTTVRADTGAYVGEYRRNNADFSVYPKR